MINTKPLLAQAHIEIMGLVDSVIDDFTSLDLKRHSQAPADMGLLTLWDEFKEQVQNGESIFFEAYEATMRQFARQYVRELVERYDSLALMVFWTLTHPDDGDDFMRGDEAPSCEKLQGVLEYIVYEFVVVRAKEQAIEYRPGYGPLIGQASKQDAPQRQMNLFEDE